jgi:hypothetical protein
MNFKKWIYSLALVLFFTVPASAEKSDFFGKGEEVLQGAGNELLESARQFVRNNYGQDFLNQITLKYGKENTGALSVLVKRFGNEGADLLKQGKSLDEIASALVKDRKLYRHIGSEAGYLENLKKTGEIPAGYTTYFSADKFDDPIEAISKMQLNSEWTDAVWVAEFDGAQLVGKVEIPKAKWNEASYLEVLTKSFPKWGEGGATQFITKSEINISKLRNLKTGDFIDFSLVNELKNAGVKFNQADVKWVFKNSEGKILFLEKGTNSAGFEHVMSHKNDFINKGIVESDISDFIMQALKENKIVAYQGTGTGRPIYELTYKGIKQRVAITTGSNGFVVGANPTSL